MKQIPILIFCCILPVLLLLLKKHRTLILCGFLAVLVCLNGFFSFGQLYDILPMARTVNQFFYQEKNLAQGSYPDAILPYLLQDKTVYTPNDFYHLTYDMNDPNAPWEHELGKIYHGRNAANLMRFSGAKVECRDELNGILPTEVQRSDFESIGVTNDMYRNSFAINEIPEEYGNYFHYYYYYTYSFREDDRKEPMQLYIQSEDLAEAEELVLLWTKSPEQLYLMSYDYYQREVAQ